MSRKIGLIFLISLLLLSTVAVASTAFIAPVASQPEHYAWLKIVTTSWKGTSDASALPGNFMPMFPAGKGFAERFNVTAQEAFVEVYSIKYDTLAVQHEGTFEPNATGFVKVSWTADPSEHAIIIVVKAKSYYGEKIGAGNLWSGIIMYALFLSPENPNTDWEKFNEWLGVKNIYGISKPKANFSWSIAGEFKNNIYADKVNGFNFTGSFDFMTINATAFEEVFGNETEDGLPVNAWVAQTAKIFKLFHVHSWYDVKDNLSFAQIKIYDLDHTDPTSERSLIQAAVTGEDGQSRYTREIYPPEEGLKGGNFENNKLVPIPLQIFNIANKTVFHGGFVDDPTIAGTQYIVGAPHLNVTVRVWWETVIVNQTIYYGKMYNTTAFGYVQPDPTLNKYVANFTGPLSILMNNSITEPVTQKDITNFINATVFYAFVCAFDNDTKIHFPKYTGGYGGYREVYALYASMDLDNDGTSDDITGDQLINARVTINLKDNKNDTYYQTKNVLTTNATGCTDDPHKYRGGIFDRYARFPNATMGDWVWKGKDAWIGSFREKFGDHVWLNVSLMYRPGDARNKDDTPDPTGSHLKDVANPPRIGDEDVLESDYYEGNWSMLVADVSYANTLTLKDDEPYDGMDIQVYWTGGWRNVYPGPSDGYLVGEVRVRNPYGIAFNKTGWIAQPTIAYDPSDNKKPSAAMSRWITWDTPILRVVENVPGVVDYRRGLINMTTYVYDISLRVTDKMGNILPPDKTEVQLILPDGQYYSREPSIDESLLTGMAWSYAHFDENVTFFQLPGNIGPYGVRVFVQGRQVYEKLDLIDVLTKTEFIIIKTPVYTIKLVFYDCENETIPQLYVYVTTPEGISSWRQTTEHGELEFAFIPEGTLTVHYAWWKGVNVALLKAEDAGGVELPLTEKNELEVEISDETNAPIKIWVPLKTLVFYTTNFQGDYKIPYLNITLTWIGTYKPWTTENVYFLETLDPTGDENGELYNTSIIVHPLWFRYKAKAFFYEVAKDSPMENLVRYEARYEFYKMPPTIYNITVTTVTEEKYGDMRTPAYSKWPGTGKDVPYEIKIHWSWETSYEDSMPEIVTGADINDRVVLRIFGSMGGVLVTPENFPDLWEAWNPDLIGIRTDLVCKEEITLRTWAHDFWKRVINGDVRVGDASFKIVNDNGMTMRYYDVEKERWIGETYTSKWTEDIFDISALRKDSLPTSNIYWNGSYLLTDMYFETNKTYSYSKGENASFIIDKFYNASAPNDVADTFNFTLVGTEKLWKTDRRFAVWKDRIEGNTYKDWYPAWFVVYELPSPEDEYVVEVGADGEKGVLPIPIPVAFIKLGAFGKDGKDNPLANALIELWILHLNATNAIDITAPSGETTVDAYTYSQDGSTVHVMTIPISWTWENKTVETDKPQVFEDVQWDRLYLTVGDVDLLLQVPPYPAKLYLRDVVVFERDGYDVSVNLVVTAEELYVLVDSYYPVDNNDIIIDRWATPDGALAYGRWYTDEDGYVNSFKDLGPDDPRYGTVVLPISGWLNETFSLEGAGAWWVTGANTKEEFHYQLNVVWESAVVYSDSFLLDKSGYEIGPTEVYNPTFYMALCNSTDTVVKGLYVTIWYPNVTTWHEKNLWYTVPDKPEDLESIEDLPVYLSANELWAEGKKRFELRPGPRFMNTTWKYTFLANHTEIDWLDNLVHTKLVLNNETFGDGALRTASPSKDIDVPIMLAAAKQVLFEVATWRAEAGVPTAYPIPGYTVKYVIRETGGGFVAAEGEAVTDAEGKVVLLSGDTVDKVFWVGMTVRYRVEPPEKFKDMAHAYYPDEEPTHWALAKIDTDLVPIGANEFWCTGLCVHDYRSKPVYILVSYTAVTVRVTDFAGRPVYEGKGAYVTLLDKASGKLAAWSYTDHDKEWYAKPLNLTMLRDYHRIGLLDARRFGGKGFTMVMNVSVGPIAYDENNDDELDYEDLERGYEHFVTYIVRVYWTATGSLEGGEYDPKVSMKVYDSHEDEVEWKTILPRYIAGRVLHIPASSAPTGAKVREHVDVKAKLFDVRLKFGYEGKPLGKDLAKDLIVTFERPEIELSLKFSGKDVVKILRLPPGTYSETAEWKRVLVDRRSIEVSDKNVEKDIALAMTDVSFKVVDMFGRSLKDAKVSVSPDTYGGFSNVGGIITIRAIVTTQTYSFKISWVSPVYGTEASVTIADTPDGLAARKVVELPVGTVTVSVVDSKGRPISGAEVTFGKETKKTDAAGKAYFEGVPLEKEGKGISYDVTVKREGFVVFTGTETVSRARTTITEIGELFTIRVRVVGAAGQGLPFAKVVIKRAGAEIGTYTTDEGGFLEVKKVPLSDYTVEVEWKGFRGSATISKEDLTAGRAVEISLPPYTEIAGVPLTFGALLALIIGFIILVIVIVILLSEYIRWRGRRLGIYPPPPPKK